MKSDIKYDVIVIGCGSSGMSAAIYLKNANLNVLIIEKDAPGGTLNKVSNINNYPGFNEQDGSLLAYNMYKQITDLNIKLFKEEVVDITNKNGFFNIKTNLSNYYECQYLIIATGKVPKKIKIKNIDDNKVSYCAVCDGVLCKNKNVVIIGDGNSALSTALYLSKICNEVYVVSKRNHLKADLENINGINNINIIYNVDINSIFKCDNGNIKLFIKDKQIDISKIFICVGNENNLSWCENLGFKISNKGICVNANLETSISNLYACGDVIDKELYQVVTAVSEGATAAYDIIRKKRNNKNS